MLFKAVKFAILVWLAYASCCIFRSSRLVEQSVGGQVIGIDDQLMIAFDGTDIVNERKLNE